MRLTAAVAAFICAGWAWRRLVAWAWRQQAVLEAEGILREEAEA